MVLRTDPQGRRWRVPHNFYRVKDHDDGFVLSGRDVLRVAELADRDKTVYRYVRRVFSPRFSPIDGDNVWHRILPELRQTELWQRLAARAAQEEDRASARTRAGHAARRGTAPHDPAPGRIVSIDGDDAATTVTGNDTDAVAILRDNQTTVATINKGSDPVVDGANDALTPIGPTFVAPVNAAAPTAVAPVNTTYNQFDLTTTTTPSSSENDEPQILPDSTSAANHSDQSTPPSALSTQHSALSTQSSSGPGGAAPTDAPGETAALRAFEDANVRPATPAERTLLRGLAARFDPAATAAGQVDAAIPSSGWAWLAAAVYEAVEAGSAFVAPRRLREILARWERDGFPTDKDRPAAKKSSSDGPAGRGRSGRASDRAFSPKKSLAASRPASTGPTSDPPQLDRPPTSDPPQLDRLPTSDFRPPTSLVELLGEGPDLMLPHGYGSRRTWAFAVGLLADVLDRSTLAALVAGTAIARYHDGEVTIAAPDPTQAERLATTHRELIARKLGEAMRRPVRVAVLTSGAGSGELEQSLGSPRPTAPSDRDLLPAALDPEPAAPSFAIVECGLPSGQVWSAVLADLAVSGQVSRANFDTWLRVTTLLGRSGEGEIGSPLIVGVPHALAQRRVAARFLPALRAALSAVIGAPLDVEIVVARDWLTSHPNPRPTPRDALSSRKNSA